LVRHFNFYPPAGAVIDASDGRVTWDGRAWKLSGRVYGVPQTHQLIGRPGGPLAGWYYSWPDKAWIEPDKPKPPSPPPSTIARPRPAQQQPARAVVAIEHKKWTNPLESLMKHPVAPVLGGVLIAAAYLTDEPQPPPMSEALPEATQKQWVMLFNQNQQRFQRRMSMYKDIGMVLLGYSSAQTILDALPKPSILAATVDSAAQAPRASTRGAM
jgi:hypothetical protein